MTPMLSNQVLRTQSDRRLAELASSGHDRAFEAIVDRYRKPLQRYLRRLLSEALAEDVLQATFVRAWQALRGGTEVRDLRPWLYRIAHNQAVNALSAASAALPEAPDVVEAAGAFEMGAGPEAEVERRDELRRTLDGIGALPDRQRAALVAVAVADRPHADVAAELGMSDGALRQLLLRARTALRAGATAITPYPLVGWLSAGQDVTATRVAEVAAGAGGVGVAFKAGAAVLAAGAVVASTPALRDEHAPSRATTTSRTTTIDDRGGRGEPEPADDRGGRSASDDSGSRSGHSGDDNSGRGSSNSGSGHSGRGSSNSGSGHSGSGSSNSGSGSSGSGSSGSGSSGSGSSGSGSSGSGSGGSGSGGSGSSGSGAGGSGSSGSGGSGSSGSGSSGSSGSGSGGSGSSGSGSSGSGSDDG
jgi:RNA polymerase sigma factor (sigma-70 family)